MTTTLQEKEARYRAEAGRLRAEAAEAEQSQPGAAATLRQAYELHPVTLRVRATAAEGHAGVLAAAQAVGDPLAWAREQGRYCKPGSPASIGQKQALALTEALRAAGWIPVREASGAPDYDRASGPLRSAWQSASSWQHDSHHGVTVHVTEGYNSRAGTRWGTVQVTVTRKHREGE